MTTHALLICAPLLAGVGLAAVIDFRERKIPNWITFTLILSGLILGATSTGMVSLGQSFLGLIVGFLLTLVLFLLGALGGGDVKLLAGIGAWLGPESALKVFALEAIIGLVIVLAQALQQRRMRTLFRNSAVLAVNLAHMNTLGVEHVKETGKTTRSVDRPLPYAVPVLIALVILICRSWR